MNENIIPQASPISLKRADPPKRAKEWAWDFENYRFARNEDGQMYQVYDDEAVKIWIWKLFKTKRWHEIVHTDLYGSDLWSLLGKGFSRGFTEAEASRIAREALEANLGRYIKSIGDIEVSNHQGKLLLKIPIRTIYSDEKEVISIES